jgi:hypothetical protein
MAEEKVSVLIDVKVDDTAAVQRQKELKVAIDATKQALTDLTANKKGAELAEAKLSTEYIKGEAQLATLNQQLRNNGTVLKQIALGSSEVSGAYAALNQKAAESKQIAKDLAVAYGSLDERTIAAQKSAKELSDQLKEVDSAVGDNQRKVGDYAGELKGLSGAFSNIPGPIGKMAGGIDGAATAFKGLSLASPIGWITPLIQLVVGFTEKLKGNKEMSEALAKAMGFVNGIFSFFTKLIIDGTKGVVDFIGGIKSFPDLLQRVGDGIKENLLNRLESFSIMGKAIVKILKGDIKEGFKDLGNGYLQAVTGVENFAEKTGKAFKAVGKAISDSTSGGSKLAELEKLFETQNRNSQKLQLQYQTQAEKLRQLRDDEARTIQQRIQSNTELGNVLKKQLADESKVANTQLQIAKLRIQQDGQTKENLDALAEAETRLIDIKERITGQESEQLANLNSLRRDAAAKVKENLKIQSDAEKLAAKERLDTLKKQADDAIAVIDNEMEMFRLKQEEANAGKQLTDQQAHQNRIAEITKENTDYLAAQKVLLDNKQIDQTTYDANVRLANQKLKTDIAIDNAAFAENEKQKKAESDAIDFQNQYDTAVLNNQSLFELERQALETKRLEEIKAAEKSGADVNLINAKYTALNIDLKKKERDANLNAASSFAGNIASIFGKNTKVGKAAASAQIAIDTYKGAMAAFASMQSLPLGLGVPAGIAAAAAVAIQGAKAIKDVWSVKSGLPGDGGGGGQSVSGAVPTATNPAAAITGGLVSRQSGQVAQQAQTMAVDTALKANPTQPVLVVPDLTTVQNQMVKLKTDNSL